MNSVVRLEQPVPGIGMVTLEDRASRNTFSRAFVEGLRDAFSFIARDETLRVIVVQGYDTYFCCGGTKEELIGITDGKLQFTDARFFDLLLQCDLPVIAAMQGHALGGGLALGAFADILVMAEEAIYSANFMRYGFTPGMGATYIIPRKFGEVLGAEMLFGALGYHGGELRQRGAGAKIVPRDKVVSTSMSIARDLADKPRISLLELKRHLAEPVRQALPAIVDRELAMHRVTFAQPEVRARIETLFGN